MATWPAMKSCRAGKRARLPAGTAPSASASNDRRRAAWIAGASPSARLVRIVTPARNSTTRPSRATSASGGKGGSRLRIQASKAYASARASTAPALESNRLSLSSKRAIRAWLAPRASRTAISRERAVARASNRWVRLAQPISNTTTTTAMSTSSPVLGPDPARSR